MKDINVEESSYNVMLGKIIQTKQMTEAEKYFEIELPNKKELGHVPGQFVMVDMPGIGDAPISVSSSPTKKGSFDLVVRDVGSVTGALHKMDKGDAVGIRGPFGNGFPIQKMGGSDLMLIAGGLGIVPLRSLINYVIDNRRDYGKVHILLGCRDPKSMLFGDDVVVWDKKMDVEFNCTVDKSDPDWKGNVGLITSLIPGINIIPKSTFAVVCGPPIMYKFVIKELLAKQIPDDRIVVSLERHMKCGVGKCGHCQIGEYYCCQDGPVFTYDQIKDKEEAF
ncbi:FAD/NAD(P)-binding protein [bacterium]|nr:FAD/NAD(P)-binding protein [bacterium]